MAPDDITSREDLVRFLEQLANDARAGRTGVENAGAADVLDGAAGWLQDMDGYFLNRGETPPVSPTWRLMAMTFAAGLVYE
jgi:hypothetical protein